MRFDRFVPAAMAALCWTVACAVDAAPPVPPLPSYHVVLLDPPGLEQPLIGGVNAVGHVAGSALVAGNPGMHAMLLDAGRAIDLGTLGGFVSYGAAVNDSDVVVGSAATPTGSLHAFAWRRGRMTDLGLLPGGSFSEALGINRRGQVTGYGDVAPGVSHAFVVDHGAMADLGVLPGAVVSFAYGINAAGHVAGASGDSAIVHATLTRDGAMVDLGSPTGPTSSSVALAINAADTTAGAAFDNAHRVPPVAVTWTAAGVATVLALPAGAGATTSYARAINDHGTIVGTFGRAPSPLGMTQGAFVSDGRHVANLEDLLAPDSAQWGVYSAMSVNEAGQVLALVFDGDYHFALLTPAAP